MIFFCVDVEKGAKRGIVDRIEVVGCLDNVEGMCRKAIDAAREVGNNCFEASISCDCRSSIDLEAGAMLCYGVAGRWLLLLWCGQEVLFGACSDVDEAAELTSQPIRVSRDKPGFLPRINIHLIFPP